MKDVPALSKLEFGLFQELLLEKSGLYFDEDRSQSLHLSIWERLTKKGLNSYGEYWNFLKSNAEGYHELQELLDLITTGETYFFRNMPQFEALQKVILPGIIEAKMHSSDKSIRVWSAGCSTGDETYSIAMAIMEALPSCEDWNISVLGTDINRNSVMFAKEAVYGQRHIDRMPAELLERYFKKNEKRYFLADSVKRIPRFERHNLARDPYTLDGMRNLDIIFCRNVTIYFDFETTKHVINNFYDCLNMGGVLFLGYTETLWGITDKLTAVEFPKTFVYKKLPYLVKEEAVKPLLHVPNIDLETIVASTPSIPEPKVPEPKEAPAPAPKSQKKKTELKFLYSLAASLVSQGEYGHALEFFEKIISLDHTNIPAYFAKATVLANQGMYQDAINVFERVVEMDNLHIDAYYIMGILLSKMGDPKGAEDKFRKVIYIDPSVALAYFNLGIIYLYTAKFNKAELEFNNAIKILNKNDKKDPVKFCEDFTAGGLLSTCKKYLGVIDAKLGRRGGL